MNALEIRDLCKSYPGFSLQNLNLTLPQGCIMGLIGENGAGKSTTIKLILEMVRRDSGSIRIFGKDNTENISLIKEDIGVVLDEVGFPECLTVKQIGNIMKNTYRNWDSVAYKKYVRELALPENKEFKDFSRGMKMKLGIAVALSHHPKLLILDEATMKRKGIDYQKKCLFIGRDIDIRCVWMAYIQMFLYQIPGIVVHGNTITMEEWSEWVTPYALLSLSQDKNPSAAQQKEEIPA